MTRRDCTTCLLAVMLTIGSTVSVLPADKQGIFIETFSGAPPSPTRWSSPNWDVVVHDRTDGATNMMHADHDETCAAPPTKHAIASHADAVFQCRDHIMTAINSSDPGYAVAYLTPAAVVDWTAGVATIEFDVSTGRSTKRDWIDLWLTPLEFNMVLPSDAGTPDLTGAPRKALHFKLINNFAWSIRSQPDDKKLSVSDWRNVPVPYSHKQRDRFTISIGSQTISMHYFNIETRQRFLIERVALPQGLGFSRAVVQFGHHSYTPSKDCDFMTIGSCGPNTWHWGNVKITPASLLTFTKIEPPGNEQTFSVVPGYLRFAARGPTEIDWGRGWVAVEPVNGPVANEGAFASFFLPVPTEASQVRLRGKATWAGPWQAKTISIWSKVADDMPTGGGPTGGGPPRPQK